MLLRLSARAAFTSFHLKAFVSSMLLHQQLEEEEGECEVFFQPASAARGPEGPAR